MHTFKSLFILALAIVVLAFPSIGGAAASGNTSVDVPDSMQVSKLLSEAKKQAFQLRADAVTMEAFTRSAISSEGHASSIIRIKRDVNAIAQELTKLNATRDASP